jgi:hypothetical protein
MSLSDIFVRKEIFFTSLAHKAIARLPKFAFDAGRLALKLPILMWDLTNQVPSIKRMPEVILADF